MSTKGFFGLIGAGIGVLLLIIGLFTFTERVPEGKVAVVYSPSGGAKKVLNPGWHLVGLFEKTQQYPTRITILKNKVTVTTKDGKSISMPTSYEMKVDRSKVLDIFKELGSQNVEQIQEGYLYQRLFRATRSVVSDYSVLDIYGTKTTEASAKITEKVADESKDLGFIITNVVLGTPELDKETEKAIDARVQAAQELELKRQQVENEKLEAEKKKIIAEGEAQKKVIAAEAEQKANQLIEKSITPELLKKMEMEARLKHGWVEIQGATPLVEAK
ncbi:prohibitin family protein [Lederbergia lenta]|uniref:prohibitin family protein n=1 Tax=Lederbergia lenta TaxID=1467 RepID=UPI00203A39ED|nr:SPFH domain-containing protein [Lederbergia lenta]MCM3109896.1 SPFH domain-containing protein [Lederbergia lenta]